ncbi:MAG TPA: PQQ-binding-like beta-propeller repeat protein [bacterium]|nr:PQQ-binding-like beta-propeller repeat protein [bacterium]
MSGEYDGPSVSYDPELSHGYVDPPSGNEDTDFTYYVDYYDQESEAPAVKCVYIDDATHEMSLASGEAFDGTYSFETSLSEGAHTYYFYFEDTGGGKCRLPSSGYYYGPSFGIWPTFQFDNQRTGWSPYLAPLAPEIRWSFEAQGQIRSAPVISSGNEVCFGDYEHNLLYCLDSSGALLWTFETKGRIDSPAALNSDDEIVFGSWDDNLYCLASSGTLLWSFDSGGDISNSGPATGPEDEVYFCSATSNKLYSVDSSGGFLWSFEADDKIDSTPSLTEDGTVLFSSRDQKCYAVSADGDLVWSFDSGAAINVAPTVLQSGNIAFGNWEGTVYCLDSTGSVEWYYDTDSPIKSSGAADCNCTFVVGTEEGAFYAIESDGTLRWTYDVEGKAISAIIDRDGVAVLACEDGYLAVVDISDGSERWQIDLGGSITSPLALDSEGVLLLGLEDGSLVAVGNYDSGLSDGQVAPTRGTSDTDFIYTVKYCSYTHYAPDEALVYIDGESHEMTLDDGFAYCGVYAFTTKLAEGSHHYYFHFTDEKANEYRLPETGAYDGPEVSDEAAGPWPMFKHDMPHSSLSEYYGPVSCEPAWSYSTGSEAISSSVAIDADSYYYFGCEDGYFYCLDSSGSPQWSYETGDSVTSSPAVSGYGNIYVGSDDEYLYAFSSEGDVLWSYDVEASVGRCSPNIDGNDGTIYMGTLQDAHLWAINSDGTLKWSFYTECEIDGSPAIDEAGNVYFGREDGYLYCLDSDGSAKWSYYCGQPVRSSPSIDSTGDIYFSCDDGYLYVLDSDGSLDWSFSLGGKETTLYGSPAVDENLGVVYVGSSDEKFYAINTDAVLNWTFNGGGLWEGSPALDQAGRVYAGSLDSKLYCFSPGGEIIWSYNMGADVSASCAIGADGSLLVGNSDGLLFKFDKTSGGLSDGRVTPTSGSTDTNFKYRVYYCNDYGYDPTVAKVHIDDDAGHEMTLESGDPNYGTYKYTTKLDEGDHNFYFYFEDTSGESYRLPEEGTYDGPYVSEGSPHPWPMFRHDRKHTSCTDFEGPLTPLIKWTFDYSEVDPINMTTPTVDYDGNIYFGSQNGDPTKFYSLNSAGEIRWTFDLDPCRINASAALSNDGILYFPTSRSYLYAITVDGEVQWSYHMGDTHEICSPVIGADGSIYLGGESPYKFYAISSAGDLLWSYDVGGSIVSSPALGEDDVICFGCHDNKLYALESDGSFKWSYQTGGLIDPSPSIDDEGNIYFGSNDQKFYALESDGSFKWSYNTGSPTFSSPALATDGTIYFGVEAAKIFALNSDGSFKWTYQTTNSVQGSPFVDKFGDIYIGSNKPGYRGEILALHPDGSLKWSYETGEWVTGSPSHDSYCNLYLTSWDGILRCFTNYDEGLSDPQVLPDCGTTETKFAYEVKYFNVYGYDAVEALVYTNGDPHEMHIEYGSAHNGIFRYHEKLSEGRHDYYFWFENDNGATYRSPEAGTFDGPEVSEGNRGPWPSYQNSGANQGRSEYRGPASPEFKWSYDGTGELLSSPVLGLDGSIYVGSNTQNKLWAFNSDGSLNWTYDCYDGIHATPVVDNDGNVYAGCNDNRLYSFDSSGSFRWSYQAGDWVHASPKVTDCGRVYFASWDGKLYALESDGTLLWTYVYSGLVYQAPAITHSGGVVIATYDGRVNRLDNEGNVEWSRTFQGSNFEAAPTVSDDQRVYIGETGSQGRLFAIDYMGYLMWSFETGSSLDRCSTAIGEDGTVYVTNQAGYLFAVESDGNLRWSYDFEYDGTVWSSPTIDNDGVIYFGARNHKLFAINSNGTLKWSYDAGENIDCTPCLTEGGQIIFGTGYLGDKLICLGNTAPELSNGSVSPESGSPSTTFTYSVDYYDADGEAPAEKLVHVDDEPFEMTLDSGDAHDGTYAYQTTLNSGSHDYYFSFEDESGGSDRLPASGSYDGPDVSYDPELSDGGVDPDSGTTSTLFTYSVDFFDGDDNAPTSILVYIDGESYGLTLESGDAWDGAYEYSIYLSEGAHGFYFYAETADGSDRLPESGTYDGPDVNCNPVLSDGTVDPESGTSATVFEYSVHYYDADQDTPSEKVVHIDGAPKTMTLDSGNPADGVYTYTTQLSQGSHYYCFYFEDGNGSSDRLPASGDNDGPEVNYVPTLSDGAVDPTFAGVSTTFAYSVRYYDADGNAPPTASVIVDGAAHSMALSDGGPGDGWYEYETTLSEGRHDYYFFFDDGDGDRARLPSSGDYEGPRVGDDHEPDDACASAGTIATTGQAQERTLVPSEDEDWVSFDADAEAKYTIETSNLGEDCDTVMELYQSDCSSLIDSDDESGEGHGSLIVFVPATAATYYVRVFPYDSETGGSYELSVRKNTNPTLSGGSVSPSSGDTDTEFEYTVHYYDADGDAPAAKNVLIGGAVHAMSLDSGDASDGAYIYTTTLSGGQHEYHFIFSDGDGGSDRLPASGEYDGPDVNFDPELANGYVTPGNGGGETEFTYRVNYYDEDGDDPLYPYVYIDDSPHEMTLESGSSASGIYSYATTLSGGSHTYYFEFEDTPGGKDREPESGSYDGPSVNIDPELSNGDVNPDHGNGETEFEFSVHYYDDEGESPNSIQVVIDDAAVDLSFSSGDPADGTYSTLSTLSSGSHEFYFTTEDPLGGTARYPESGAIDGPIVSYDPVLSAGAVSPEYGSESTLFAFSVHYYDQDGDEPDEILALVDEEQHSMTLTDGDAADGTYKYETGGLSEGTHDFYFTAEDTWGADDRHPEEGDFSGPTVDTMKPTSECSSPQYATGDIEIAFTASDNDGGRGLAYTRLWFKYEEGDFEYSGLSEEGTEGTIVFTPESGEGTYYFYTIATDNVGNSEDAPEDPDDSTLYDVSSPSSSCEAPESRSESPIEVSFTSSDGDGSGVDKTVLWYELDDGSWTDSGLVESGEAGAFSFEPGADGVYYFYTIASDNAGNEEDPPGTFDDSTLYDTAPPVSSADCESVTNEASVTIDFASSDGEGSGVASTALWYKYESGSWQDSSQSESGESGSFVFSFSGEGTYYFHSISTDELGNEENPPSSADCQCEYDITDPSSSCETPTYAKSTPMSVDFSASDSGTGIQKVRLWSKFEDGSWEDSGKQSSSASGSFDFNLTDEGTYYFYTIATDNASNEEAPPSGADDSTIYDKTRPASEVTSPTYAYSSPIEVDFTASDSGGSGLQETALWYKRGSASWTDSGLDESGESGTFEFSPSADGTYYFGSRAIDYAQNRESLPGTPDDSTVYDTKPPTSSCSCQDYTNEATTTISYGASDAGSGVDTVALWHKFESSGWTYTGETKSGAAGTFSYTCELGEGRYYFYTIATDNAGREESPPSSADCDIVYDTVKPSSEASSPDMANSSPIIVTFTASDNSGGSGVQKTELWYAFEGGSFSYSGQYKTGSAGSFNLTASSDGTYEFYTVCVDNAENREEAPGEADDSTLLDTTAPQSSCSAPDCTSESPIPVEFTASDDGSGVASTALLYCFEGGEWTDSGVSESGDSGVLYFEPDEDGTYQFYTLSLDEAGNVEDPPDEADTTSRYDTAEPASACTVPEYVNSSPISVTFESSDGEGCGVASTVLWFRFSDDEGETWSPDWTDSGISAEDESGTLEFTPSSGNGLYEFYTICLDAAGNVEDPPGEADDATEFDDRVPITTCDCPEWASGATISVEYLAKPGSEGLDEVELWFRYWSEDGHEWSPNWTFSGETGEETEGEISFGPGEGEGLYEFYTIGVSEQASREKAPSEADCSANYDPEAPSSSCESETGCTSEDSVEITFTAEDTFAGIDAVYLYYRLGGEWTESGLYSEETSGHFEFTFPEGNGLYEFCTVAEDTVGNVEEFPPDPDAATRFDTSAPSSEADSISVTRQSPIIVTFTASDGQGCGVHETALWYQFDGGDWTDTNQQKSGESGSFTFSPGSDGIYGFYTICEDTVSNEEMPPAGADCETKYDTTAPSSYVTTPGKANSSPIKVSFWASDGTSGVASTDLWFRFSADDETWDPDWTDSGQSQSGTSGHFYFDATTYGNGFYEFYSIADDNAGNVEEPPADADCAATFDDQVPISLASSDDYVNTASLTVSYTASGGTSGLDFVELWYRYSDDEGQSYSPDWTDTGERRSATQGSFSLTLTHGEGWYEFYTIAVGNTGVYEDAPEEADTRTTFDTVRPASDCESDEYSATTSTVVSYSASDDLSGVAFVYLYYSYNGGGYVPYEEHGTENSGNITFVFEDGDGPYSFHTIAEDRSGNLEDAPSTADASIFLDTAVPQSLASCDEYASQTTIEVTFAASDGAGSGVDGAWLYYSFGGSDWEATGDWLAGASGSYSFEAEEEGRYSFCTVSQDIAGNTEELPEEPDCSILVDTTAPSSYCTSPDYASGATVAVNFTAADSGSGVALTTVWFRMQGGQWLESGIWEEGTIGTIAVEIATEGTAEFCTVCRDILDNTEEPPTQPDAETVVDRTSPVSSCEAPEQTASSPISVSFEAQDSLTDITDVQLWYQVNGDWELYDSRQDMSSGTFTFAPETDGQFEFYTLAKDTAGNLESPPTQATCATWFDTCSPSSVATSPTVTNASLFGVGFIADDEAGVGQLSVRLWYRLDEGDWTDSGLDGEGTSGSIEFGSDSEGVYDFYTIASDGVGNVESAPESPDSTTVFDVSVPRSTCGASQYANSFPIVVDFASSDDGDAGLLETELWYSFNGGEFISAALREEGEAGQFDFTPKDGPGIYDIYTVATDNAGNVESPPEGYDVSVIYDPIAARSSCTSPEFSKTTAFEIAFEADDDGPSGVLETRLWVSFNGGSWVYTGLSRPGESGVFSFAAQTGEGRYDFYTICLDKAGNSEEAPSQRDCTTVIDLTGPVSCCSCTPWGNSFPAVVEFTASDTGGSNLLRTELYFSQDGSDFASTGLYGQGQSGAFNFTGTVDQDAIYAFYTVASDGAANTEAPPTDTDCAFVYDITAPSSSCSSPPVTNAAPIPLAFTSDDGVKGSSVATVGLLCTFNGGDWRETSLEATTSTGQFDFTPSEGEGTYGFCTVALDRARNAESIPDGADSVTIYDTTAPTSSCSSPAYTNVSVVPVVFEVSDGLSGASGCGLWYRTEAGDWEDSGHWQDADSGTFDFHASSEGRYSFQTVAVDVAANRQAEPTEESPGCSTTVYDATPPTASTTSPETSNQAPIAVQFETSDNLSPVVRCRLWYRFEDGPWTDTGSAIEASSGQFEFAPASGEGRYDFYAQSKDTADNEAPDPDAATEPHSSTAYDTVSPSVVFCTSSEFANSLPIAVHYEVAELTTQIAAVHLWFRHEGGSWTDSALQATTSTGEFAFEVQDIEGAYEFYIVAEDTASNSSPEPQAGTTGLSETLYDRTSPTSEASVPQFTATLQVWVDFTASDALSGVSKTRLWFMPEGKDWHYSGIEPPGESGTYDFMPSNPNERYLFYTQAIDNAGNREPGPETPADAKAQTLCDRIKPESQASCPGYTSDRNLSIDFSASDDGSGVLLTELWYRFNDGEWLKTSMSSGELSGQLSLSLPGGEGRYSFYTQSKDRAGNAENAPTASTECKCSTVYDVTVPSSQCNIPQYPKTNRLSVEFDSVDALSGVDRTLLWYRFESGAWVNTKLVRGEASGEFEFVLGDGQGAYEFYTQAVDRAGNIAPSPSSHTAEGCRCMYDIEAPVSSSSCPDEVDSLPILVHFTADDVVSGVDTTRLYYSFDDADWADSELALSGDSGTFEFDPSEGEGTYCFYTISTDVSGNVESVEGITDPSECCVLYQEEAAAPNVAVAIGSNLTFFCPASDMEISLEYENTGGPVVADLYLAVELPQSMGGSRIFWTGTNLESQAKPLEENVSLYSGIHRPSEVVFQFGPMGHLPEGIYTWSSWFCETETHEIVGNVAELTFEFTSKCMNLSLSTNQERYSRGDDLSLLCDAENAGESDEMDFYCAVSMPDGTFLFLPNLGISMQPMMSHLVLPVGQSVTDFPIFSFRDLPELPHGQYAWFAACLNTQTGLYVSNLSVVGFTIAP